MNLIKISFAALMLTALAACDINIGTGEPSDGPIELDATGASSLELGSAGSLADTDVHLIGTDDDVILVTPEGGSVSAGLSGGTVEVGDAGATAVTIEAPSDMAYVIFLNNQNATVEDVEAPGVINVNNGDVSVDGATETLAVNVNQGEVDVRYTTADIPEVAINVNQGDVELTLPEDANAEIAITASNVTFVGVDLDGVEAAGIATGTLGAGGGSIAINTTGSVTIRGE